MATVKELRERAKAAGIKGYSRMRKAELESALSIQTTTEKTSEKAEHLLRASYWEQKTLLNEEYSLYDIVRLLAEYGVRNSLYEYECKQYFFRTGKKAKADFILKQVLLDWLHERAEEHEKVSEPISAERTEEAKAALKIWTDEDFNAYFPDGEVKESDLLELTSDELDSLNDYLNRRRDADEARYRSSKYPLMLRKQPDPEPDDREGDMLYVIQTGDDIGEMQRKLEHNFLKVERSPDWQDMTYLLGTTNLHTVYLMLKARGYETRFEEWQSVKSRVVSDFVKQEMREREERKIRELRITRHIYLLSWGNAKQRQLMCKERSRELKEQLEINRMYAATFMRSGHEVPEALRALIADESEEYHEVRLSSFRSYVKYREYKAKYDEAEIALELLESYESKKELSA